jgi:ribosomal protein S20
MDDQEQTRQIREEFQKSRIGAVLRCTEIMIDSGRKDLAKQILATTHIDRSKLAELKTQIS